MKEPDFDVLTCPILFVRGGWMAFYAGFQPGDERLVGGGSYNNEYAGHERFNFSPIHGRLYGYVQPTGKEIHLARVESGTSEDCLDNALVVCFADQRVVGWYRRATIFARRQKLSGKDALLREDCGYYFTANAKECVLLPTDARRCFLPRKKNGTGQSNITYALNPDGSPKNASWIDDVRRWIDDYDGANLLVDPLEEAEDASAEKAASTASQGQGFSSDPEVRRAVERHAVERASAYYRKKGYVVTEKGKPYDLLCEKSGKRLYVEVKGTQGTAATVVLTANEVQFARKHQSNMELYVVHSVVVERESGQFKTKNGVSLVLSQWSPKDVQLRPISFWYDLPKT